MGKKIYKIPFWLTAAIVHIRERFVMKTYSFYEHPAVQSLSPSAYKVYDFMCKECGGNMEFVFPNSVIEKITTPPTFRAARKELIEKGFIEIVQNNANLRKPNLYRFTDRWKKGF